MFEIDGVNDEIAREALRSGDETTSKNTRCCTRRLVRSTVSIDLNAPLLFSGAFFWKRHYCIQSDERTLFAVKRAS